jgi:hypothetical protein
VEIATDNCYAIRFPDSYRGAMDRPNQASHWVLNEIYLYPKRGKELKLALEVTDMLAAEGIDWCLDDGNRLALHIVWE